MRVANVSRKWSRKTWVAKRGSRNVGHEWESRNVGRETWVANGSRENKKIRGVCNGDPEGSNELIKILYERNIYIVENIGPSWLGPSSSVAYHSCS